MTRAATIVQEIQDFANGARSGEYVVGSERVFIDDVDNRGHDHLADTTLASARLRRAIGGASVETDSVRYYRGDGQAVGNKRYDTDRVTVVTRDGDVPVRVEVVMPAARVALGKARRVPTLRRHGDGSPQERLMDWVGQTVGPSITAAGDRLGYNRTDYLLYRGDSTEPVRVRAGKALRLARRAIGNMRGIVELGAKATGAAAAATAAEVR